MNKKNKLLLAAAVSIIGGSWLTSTQVFAQETQSELNPMSTLVQKIADRFGLNQSDVQEVFDQSRDEMEKQRQADLESKLSQLVTDSKITETQKQLILAKHQELATERQENRDKMRNMSETDRETAMESERAELTKWANENGIDLQYLMIARGQGPGMHGGRGEFAPTK